MGDAGIAFYVLGALLVLYIVAATWRSRDTSDMRRPPARRSPRRSDDGSGGRTRANHAPPA